MRDGVLEVSLGLDRDQILNGAIGTLLGGLLLALIPRVRGFYGFAAKYTWKRLMQGVTQLAWALRTFWRTFWRQVLVVISFIGFLVLVFVIYGDIVAVGLIVALVALLVIAYRLFFVEYSLPLSRAQYITVGLSEIANSEISGRYRNFRLETRKLGSVEFLLEPGKSIFDSSKARSHPPLIGKEPPDMPPDMLPPLVFEEYIRAFGEEPVRRVVAVHCLINAGGAFKKDPETGYVYEGKELGSIELGFSAGPPVHKIKMPLILGDTIREWAIGNFPGELISLASNRHSWQVWKGKNRDGNKAVIDRLEIPVTREHTRRANLASIHIEVKTQYLPKNSRGGRPEFFILAITLEVE